MKNFLILIAMLLLVSCQNKESDYEITQPINGKHHAIIKLKNNNKGFCSAFVIDDKTAMTAGHCLNMTNSWYMSPGHKKKISDLQRAIEVTAINIESFRQSCFINCEAQLAQGYAHQDKLEADLKWYMETKVDEIKISDINGKDTGIVGRADYKDGKRDYGFIKGDFKKFNKMKLKKGFDTHPGDLLKVCGFPGSKRPAVCVDFIAIGSFNFQYRGSSMFMRGISGSPVIDSNNEVIGVASSVQGPYSYIAPILGTVNFE
jgi:trypsin